MKNWDKRKQQSSFDPCTASYLVKRCWPTFTTKHNLLVTHFMISGLQSISPLGIQYKVQRVINPLRITLLEDLHYVLHQVVGVQLISMGPGTIAASSSYGENIVDTTSASSTAAQKMVKCNDAIMKVRLPQDFHPYFKAWSQHVMFIDLAFHNSQPSHSN